MMQHTFLRPYNVFTWQRGDYKRRWATSVQYEIAAVAREISNGPAIPTLPSALAAANAFSKSKRHTKLLQILQIADVLHLGAREARNATQEISCPVSTRKAETTRPNVSRP